MSSISIRNLFLAPVLSLAMAGAALAAPAEAAPLQNAQVDNFVVGKKAIDAK